MKDGVSSELDRYLQKLKVAISLVLLLSVAHSISPPRIVAPLSLHFLSIVSFVLLVKSFGIAWYTMVIHDACCICLTHSYWINNFVLRSAEL